MKSFPMAILIEGQTFLTLIDTPDNLPRGKNFKIILVGCTHQEFQAAIKVHKMLSVK